MIELSVVASLKRKALGREVTSWSILYPGYCIRILDIYTTKPAIKMWSIGESALPKSARSPLPRNDDSATEILHGKCQPGAKMTLAGSCFIKDQSRLFFLAIYRGARVKRITSI